MADLQTGRDVAFEKALEELRLDSVKTNPVLIGDIQSALEFLKQLKETARLPGRSREQRGEAHLESYSFFGPQTLTFTGRKRGEATDVRHTVTRVSQEGPWELRRAWRTDRRGRMAEEYPVR